MSKILNKMGLYSIGWSNGGIRTKLLAVGVNTALVIYLDRTAEGSRNGEPLHYYIRLMNPN